MMKETAKILCTTCPKGCLLEVTHDGQTIIEIKSGCKRGQEYGRRELIDPRRMVASTVKINGGLHPLLPVYTSAPFPKKEISNLMKMLRQVEISAPVKMGDTIVKDALGTGINIVASRNIDIKDL